MKKIVFGITGLTLGGAERVLVDMANALVDKYEVTIFTLYGKGELESQLKPNVKRVTYQNKSRNELSKINKIRISFIFRFNFFRKRLYKKYIKNNYNVEVAFLEGPITWMFSYKSKARKLVWVHNDIKEVFGDGFKAKQKVTMNKEIYSLYGEIIFVSKDNQSKFEEFYPDNRVSKRVIYNYLDKDKVIKKAKSKVNDIKHDLMSFVQVSRLTSQKGIDRLINVHTKLINDGYNHRIYIVGDGPLMKELQTMIIENNITDTFILLGKKSNPYPYINECDNFMLVSYYEGYGMVIDEAKILNKFIMITDTAAREAIVGYNNALIVSNDENGIYEGMRKVIKKEFKRKSNNPTDNRDIIGDIIKVLEGE